MQVEPVPLIADAEPSLTTDESKVAAQLQQKRLQLRNERSFEIGLGVLVFQREELEQVGLLDLLPGRQRIARELCASATKHRCFVLREERALVELATNLPAKLPDSPAAPQRLPLIEPSGLGLRTARSRT